jgi:hypothetical protein
MKKTLFALIFIATVNICIFGQDAESKIREKRFTIQINPLPLLIDIARPIINRSETFFMIDLEGQYKINDIFNVSLSLSFGIEKPPFIYMKQEITQFNIKPMFIYRPFGTGLKGFYVGLYPTIGWCSINYANYTWHGHEFSTIVGFGSNFGYKWVFKKGFSLQLGMGVGKSWFIPKISDKYFIASDLRIIMENVDIQFLDIKLGFSF